MDERSRGNVRDPGCPGRRLFDLVTSRWAALVLVDLMEGPLRWSELRRRAGGVSDKMLAQTLRELEASGLVSRAVRESRPPSVEYALTDLGRGATDPLLRLQDWAEEHTGDFVRRREEHDADPRR